MQRVQNDVAQRDPDPDEPVPDDPLEPPVLPPLPLPLLPELVVPLLPEEPELAPEPPPASSRFWQPATPASMVVTAIRAIRFLAFFMSISSFLWSGQPRIHVALKTPMLRDWPDRVVRRGVGIPCGIANDVREVTDCGRKKESKQRLPRRAGRTQRKARPVLLQEAAQQSTADGMGTQWDALDA